MSERINISIKVIGAEISVPSGLGLKGDGLWSFTDYPIYRNFDLFT